MSAANWIAAEYDGKSLRSWSMQGPTPAGQDRCACVGIPGLADALQAFPDLPVLLADMSGTYPARDFAAAPTSAKLTMVNATAGERPFRIARGVTQAEPAARLHGQTALVAGLLAADPQFDGVICITGRHSHWIRVSAQEICHFHGYLSGELMEWIAGDCANAAIAEPDIFLSALDDALSRPHRAHGRLLALRGAMGSGAAQLAGLLIGCELADAKPYWLGETVAICGNGPLAGLYALAVERQGGAVLRPDHDAALLAGLHAAWKIQPRLRATRA